MCFFCWTSFNRKTSNNTIAIWKAAMPDIHLVRKSWTWDCCAQEQLQHLHTPKKQKQSFKNINKTFNRYSKFRKPLSCVQSLSIQTNKKTSILITFTVASIFYITVAGIKFQHFVDSIQLFLNLIYFDRFTNAVYWHHNIGKLSRSNSNTVFSEWILYTQVCVCGILLVLQGGWTGNSAHLSCHSWFLLLFTGNICYKM